MADSSVFFAAIPGVIVGIGAIITGRNSKKEIQNKTEQSYVTLTKQSTDLVLDRIEELKTDNMRCTRNMASLRRALINAHIDVPDLE